MSPNFKETKQSLDHARTLAGGEVAVTPSLEGQVLQYSTGRGVDLCHSLVTTACHFASNDAQFDAMVNEMCRVITGCMLFCPLALFIGMEERVTLIAGRRFALPDGSERYLVDEAMLMDLAALPGMLLDPLKTALQDQHCMMTSVARKM